MTGTETRVKDKNLADAMLEIMESLTSVMDYEVDLLARRDYAGLNGLRQEKARLVRDYQLKVHCVAEDPKKLSSAAPDVRHRLRQEGERLEVASRRNARELEAAIHVAQSLVQTVVEAARNGLADATHYKDPRALGPVAGSYSPVAQPVAVDKSA